MPSFPVDGQDVVPAKSGDGYVVKRVPEGYYLTNGNLRYNAGTKVPGNGRTVESPNSNWQLVEVSPEEQDEGVNAQHQHQQELEEHQKKMQELQNHKKATESLLASDLVDENKKEAAQESLENIDKAIEEENSKWEARKQAFDKQRKLEPDEEKLKAKLEELQNTVEKEEAEVKAKQKKYRELIKKQDAQGLSSSEQTKKNSKALGMQWSARKKELYGQINALKDRLGIKEETPEVDLSALPEEQAEKIEELDQKAEKGELSPEESMELGDALKEAAEEAEGEPVDYEDEEGEGAPEGEGKSDYEDVDEFPEAEDLEEGEPGEEEPEGMEQEEPELVPEEVNYDLEESNKLSARINNNLVNALGADIDDVREYATTRDDLIAEHGLAQVQRAERQYIHSRVGLALSQKGIKVDHMADYLDALTATEETGTGATMFSMMPDLINIFKGLGYDQKEAFQNAYRMLDRMSDPYVRDSLLSWQNTFDNYGFVQGIHYSHEGYGKAIKYSPTELAPAAKPQTVEPEDMKVNLMYPPASKFEQVAIESLKEAAQHAGLTSVETMAVMGNLVGYDDENKRPFIQLEKIPSALGHLFHKANMEHQLTPEDLEEAYAHNQKFIDNLSLGSFGMLGDDYSLHEAYSNLLDTIGNADDLSKENIRNMQRALAQTAFALLKEGRQTDNPEWSTDDMTEEDLNGIKDLLGMSLNVGQILSDAATSSANDMLLFNENTIDTMPGLYKPTGLFIEYGLKSPSELHLSNFEFTPPTEEAEVEGEEPPEEPPEGAPEEAGTPEEITPEEPTAEAVENEEAAEPEATEEEPEEEAAAAEEVPEDGEGTKLAFDDGTPFTEESLLENLEEKNDKVVDIYSADGKKLYGVAPFGDEMHFIKYDEDGNVVNSIPVSDDYKADLLNKLINGAINPEDAPDLYKAMEEINEQLAADKLTTASEQHEVEPAPGTEAEEMPEADIPGDEDMEEEPEDYEDLTDTEEDKAEDAIDDIFGGTDEEEAPEEETPEEEGSTADDAADIGAVTYKVDAQLESIGYQIADLESDAEEATEDYQMRLWELDDEVKTAQTTPEEAKAERQELERKHNKALAEFEENKTKLQQQQDGLQAIKENAEFFVKNGYIEHNGEALTVDDEGNLIPYEGAVSDDDLILQGLPQEEEPEQPYETLPVEFFNDEDFGTESEEETPQDTGVLDKEKEAPRVFEKDTDTSNEIINGVSLKSVKDEVGNPDSEPEKVTEYFSNIPDVEVDEPENAAVNSTGVVFIEPDGRIWIRKVSGGFGGYNYSFSKGKTENGISFQQNALKETYEELGFVGNITGFIADMEGTTGVSRFYLGERTGGSPADAGWETENVVLLTPDEALGQGGEDYLNMPRDQKLAEILKKYIAENIGENANEEGASETEEKPNPFTQAKSQEELFKMASQQLNPEASKYLKNFTTGLSLSSPKKEWREKLQDPKEAQSILTNLAISLESLGADLNTFDVGAYLNSSLSIMGLDHPDFMQMKVPSESGGAPVIYGGKEYKSGQEQAEEEAQTAAEGDNPFSAANNDDIAKEDMQPFLEHFGITNETAKQELTKAYQNIMKGLQDDDAEHILDTFANLPLMGMKFERMAFKEGNFSNTANEQAIPEELAMGLIQNYAEDLKMALGIPDATDEQLLDKINEHMFDPSKEAQTLFDSSMLQNWFDVDPNKDIATNNAEVTLRSAINGFLGKINQMNNMSELADTVRDNIVPIGREVVSAFKHAGLSDYDAYEALANVTNYLANEVVAIPKQIEEMFNEADKSGKEEAQQESPWVTDAQVQEVGGMFEGVLNDKLQDFINGNLDDVDTPEADDILYAARNFFEDRFMSGEIIDPYGNQGEEIRGDLVDTLEGAASEAGFAPDEVNIEGLADFIMAQANTAIQEQQDVNATNEAIDKEVQEKADEAFGEAPEEVPANPFNSDYPEHSIFEEYKTGDAAKDKSLISIIKQINNSFILGEHEEFAANNDKDPDNFVPFYDRWVEKINQMGGLPGVSLPNLLTDLWVALGANDEPSEKAKQEEAADLKADVILGEQIAAASGTNPGGVYKGTDGKERYVKFYSDGNQAAGEYFANTIYNQLGIGAPVSSIFKHDGNMAYASEMLPDVTQLNHLPGTPELAKKVMNGFLADVLLANWDAVGLTMDNIVVDDEDNVYRIDNGGALLHRAQGAMKPESINSDISEIEKFLDPNTNKAYAEIAKAAGYTSSEQLHDLMREQLANVDKMLEEHGGSWQNLVNSLRGGADVSNEYTDKVASLLENRYNLLKELLGKDEGPEGPEGGQEPTTKASSAMAQLTEDVANLNAKFTIGYEGSPYKYQKEKTLRSNDLDRLNAILDPLINNGTIDSLNIDALLNNPNSGHSSFVGLVYELRKPMAISSYLKKESSPILAIDAYSNMMIQSLQDAGVDPDKLSESEAHTNIILPVAKGVLGQMASLDTSEYPSFFDNNTAYMKTFYDIMKNNPYNLSSHLQNSLLSKVKSAAKNLGLNVETGKTVPLPEDKATALQNLYAPMPKNLKEKYPLAYSSQSTEAKHALDIANTHEGAFFLEPDIIEELGWQGMPNPREAALQIYEHYKNVMGTINHNTAAGQAIASYQSGSSSTNTPTRSGTSVLGYTSMLSMGEKIRNGEITSSSDPAFRAWYKDYVKKAYEKGVPPGDEYAMFTGMRKAELISLTAAQYPMPVDTVVYRKISSSAMMGAFTKAHPEMAQSWNALDPAGKLERFLQYYRDLSVQDGRGDFFADGGIDSTTLHPKNNIWAGDIKMVIKVPKGAPVLPIGLIERSHGYQSHPQEYEALGAHNLQMRILKVEGSTMYAEYVLPGEGETGTTEPEETERTLKKQEKGMYGYGKFTIKDTGKSGSKRWQVIDKNGQTIGYHSSRFKARDWIDKAHPLKSKQAASETPNTEETAATPTPSLDEQKAQKLPEAAEKSFANTQSAKIVSEGIQAGGQPPLSLSDVNGDIHQWVTGNSYALAKNVQNMRDSIYERNDILATRDNAIQKRQQAKEAGDTKAYEEADQEVKKADEAYTKLNSRTKAIHNMMIEQTNEFLKALPDKERRQALEDVLKKVPQPMDGDYGVSFLAYYMPQELAIRVNAYLGWKSKQGNKNEG